MPSVSIEIRDLSYAYPGGFAALKGITLSFQAGGRTALLGQNGAGKTTLAKHLNGLLKPSAGTVSVGGWDTRQHSVAQLASRVGFSFQNPGDQLFKTRVSDEVAFGPRNLGVSQAQLHDQVAVALSLCGLEDVKDAHPYDLSPSERRWVAIASVLAMGTPVVVMDEPTTGQDGRGMARLVRVLDWLTNRGTTVLVVTHDLDFAVENFDDLVILAQGEVVVRGGSSILGDDAVAARAGLGAPQLMRLAQALGWDERPRTPTEFNVLLRTRRSS